MKVRSLSCVAASVGVLGALAHSATAQANWSSEVLVRKASTLAVVSAPGVSLKLSPKFSLDFNPLLGYNMSSQNAAIGGSITHTWGVLPGVGLTFGLGNTFDTSRSFQISDISIQNTGFVAGISITWP